MRLQLYRKHYGIIVLVLVIKQCFLFSLYEIKVFILEEAKL